MAQGRLPPWVPSLDISQFLGQLLGLCQMGAFDTPSAPQPVRGPWLRGPDGTAEETGP